jgi:hypothetical protein
MTAPSVPRKPSVAERLKALEQHVMEEVFLNEIASIRAAVEAVARDARAHGSHWRMPYQAFAYDFADRLAPEAKKGEKR